MAVNILGVAASTAADVVRKSELDAAIAAVPSFDATAFDNLTARVSVISNFASPNAGGLVVGAFYDNSFQGTGAAIITGVGNRVELAPYYTSTVFTADQLGVNVTTITAGALGRIVVYGSDADGWPSTQLFEGATSIDMGVLGYRFHAEDFVFQRGTQYWVGILTSSTARYSGVNVSSAVNLGLTASNGTTYATILRRTITYASGTPATWVYNNAERIANAAPPSIRLRVKSVP